MTVDLKIYAENLEQEAMDQIKTLVAQPAFDGAKVRIMPDAHAGAGCVIGFTANLGDKVVPNLVGVDIGCGMLTADVGHGRIDLPGLDKACHAVPHGFDVWDGRRERFDLEELRCFRQLHDTGRMERSIGTLGGGNHFVEVDVDDSGRRYVVIHSGSRNLGLQVAKHYQSVAVDLRSGKGELFDRKRELIEAYKAQGRHSEIQGALVRLESEYGASEPDVPRDLCWLDGTWAEDYLHDVAVCQRFAMRNRERMLTEIVAMTGLDVQSSFHTVHNYIGDDGIIRKGAISAREGETVLIPFNMRDGSVIARGKGNEDWNNSAPHGAGRIMSRTKARATLDVGEFESQMDGVYSTTVCEGTLDEAPGAYKPADAIMGLLGPTVDVVERLKPIYNFKAVNEGRRR